MIEQVIRQTKKRLGLFSPRRLGSPPPELPNYSRILGLVFSVVNVTLVIGFCRNAEGNLKRYLELDSDCYGCFCQVWPVSEVVQSSAFEVEILPCWGSAN